MSDIDWDLAPKGAVEIKINFSNKSINFFNGYGEYYSNGKWFKPIYIGDWELIATRPQDPREEYEKARAQEWNGKGLPPVGVECEIKHKDATEEWAQPDFHRATVKAYGDYLFILAGENGDRETVGSIDEYLFRPIKTQITKVQAWDMFMSGYAAEHIKETYDVVDEFSEVQS